MKSDYHIAITRKMDSLGRVVIPKEIRDILHISRETALEIFLDGNTVILKEYQQLCQICRESGQFITYNNMKICKKCIKELAAECRI